MTGKERIPVPAKLPPTPLGSVVIASTRSTPFKPPVSKDVAARITVEKVAVRFSEVVSEDLSSEIVVMPDGTTYSTLTLKFLGMKNFELVNKEETP
jgi:hypothetical protein